MNFEKLNDPAFCASVPGRISGILEKSGCPGLSVSVCGADRVLLECAGGTVNSSTCDPVTAGSVFWGDQLAAPVVAYLTWKLTEEGLFDPDRPLIDYFETPFLPEQKGRDRLTANTVLTQTSGLPRRKDPDRPICFEIEPGTVFSYSNYALLVLQRALEGCLKADLQTAAEQYVFRPFRMNASSFVWKDAFEASFAYPHDGKGTVNLRVRAEKPNAGKYFYTTPHDYCLFLNKLCTEQSSRKCLSSEMRARMLRPRTELYRNLRWAAGIGSVSEGESETIWQFGDQDGTKSLAFADLSRGVCGCAMSNGEHGFRACQEIWKELLGEKLPAWEAYSRFSLEKAAFELRQRSARKKFSGR